MIEKTGSLIKKVAIASFCIEVSALIIGVIWGLTKIISLANSFSQMGEAITVSSNGSGTIVLWGLFGIIAVIALLFVKNLLIYGLGELIENSEYTRANTEYIAKQMICLSDTADGVQFLCNQSLKGEKSSEAIYQVLSKTRVAQGQLRGSGTNIEWECPQCGTKNPLKAHFCMNCGTEN